jgi:hypothetical protein
LRKSASTVLNEETARAKDTDRYDVFLSHCYEDAEAIVGVKAILESQGQRVYVDWIDDKQLSRDRVTPSTAAILRKRMRQSDSLIFATSKASPDSKWMPWELGYFDGFRPNRIAVFPLVAAAGQSFAGQEYLGLYPVVEKLPTKDQTAYRAYVTKGLSSVEYLDLGSFKAGASQFMRR